MILFPASTPDPNEQLEEIFYALTLGIDDHLWAKSLGESQYEIQSIPFIARDLNFKDVVLVQANPDDKRLYVRQVIRRSGHKTLGFEFETANDEQMREVLSQLVGMQARYERRSKLDDFHVFSLDIAPEANYDKIYDFLKTLEAKGVLRCW